MVYSVRKFCGFLRCFFKSALKRRFGTAVPTFFDNIKNAVYTAFFRTHCHLGFRPPKPDARDFSEKSPLELQKLYSNKMVCSVQSSLAYLYPKRKVSYFMSVTMPINIGIWFSLSIIIYTKGLSRTTSFVGTGGATAVFFIVTPVTAAAFVPFSLTVICVL